MFQIWYTLSGFSDLCIGLRCILLHIRILCKIDLKQVSIDFTFCVFILRNNYNFKYQYFILISLSKKVLKLKNRISSWVRDDNYVF